MNKPMRSGNRSGVVHFKRLIIPKVRCEVISLQKIEHESKANEKPLHSSKSSSNIEAPLPLACSAHAIEPPTLAQFISATLAEQVRRVSVGLFNICHKRIHSLQLVIVDCRCFLDYNESHVLTAVNAFYSKLARRRLMQNKVSFSSDALINIC